MGQIVLCQVNISRCLLPTIAETLTTIEIADVHLPLTKDSTDASFAVCSLTTPLHPDQIPLLAIDDVPGATL